MKTILQVRTRQVEVDVDGGVALLQVALCQNRPPLQQLRPQRGEFGGGQETGLQHEVRLPRAVTDCQAASGAGLQAIRTALGQQSDETC